MRIDRRTDGHEHWQPLFEILIKRLITKPLESKNYQNSSFFSFSTTLYRQITQFFILYIVGSGHLQTAGHTRQHCTPGTCAFRNKISCTSKTGSHLQNCRFVTKSVLHQTLGAICKTVASSQNQFYIKHWEPFANLSLRHKISSTSNTGSHLQISRFVTKSFLHQTLGAICKKCHVVTKSVLHQTLGAICKTVASWRGRSNGYHLLPVVLRHSQPEAWWRSRLHVAMV
jgi:hypothetical protein